MPLRHIFSCSSIAVLSIGLSGCFKGQVDPFSSNAEVCADLKAILAALDETPIPFKSLRDAPATFPSGEIINGSWETQARVNGTPCTLGEVGGFGNDGDIQVLRCTFNPDAVFQDEAIEDFEIARRYVEPCLPPEFVAQSNPEQILPGTSIVYQRDLDKERQSGSKFFVYPINLQYAKEKRSTFGPSRAKASVNIAFQSPNKEASN